MEKAEEQARLLEKNERELAMQIERQAKLKQQIEQKEEEKIQMEEKYSSLTEEAQGKKRKLKKLRTMILKAQSEYSDIQADHQREKEGLLESLREMSKELKLQNLIINSYIPVEYQVSHLAFSSPLKFESRP